MSDHRALVTLRASDAEADALLHAARAGPPEARDRALAALAARARATDDADRWAAAALGYHLAGDHGAARRILRPLVARHPDVDAFRLNLAASYAQVESVEVCRYHLGHLAARGSTAEWRELGRRQLAGYEAFVGLTDAQRRGREREIAALRETLAGPEAEPAHAVALALLLLRKNRLEPASGAMAEATALLERACATFPDDVAALEVLVACYLHEDPGGRLGATRRRLARLAPGSPVLRILAESEAPPSEAPTFEVRRSRTSAASPGPATPEARVFDLHRQADELLEIVGSADDGALRQAAVADLARVVATFPGNPHYRLRYAWALMEVGSVEAAVEQARRMAHLDDRSHGFHFNLAQVLWRGDVTAARRHLALAYAKAGTDDERRDVNVLTARLEAGAW